jgi:TPR repeat protein
MKGEKQYRKAISILTQLYNKDYMYENKILSKMDMYDLYIKYLRRAAYLKFPLAQYDLAQTYENINFWGINQNYSSKKCIFWYKKACLNNVPSAFNNLAGFYEGGIGVKQDLLKALELYEKAGDLGDLNGKNNYKILLKQMDHWKNKQDFSGENHSQNAKGNR